MYTLFAYEKRSTPENWYFTMAAAKLTDTLIIISGLLWTVTMQSIFKNVLSY